MEKVHIHFGVVIPVGHQVEILWPEMGGGPHEPVVKDLDTGVVYAPLWACDRGELKPMRAVRAIRGRVQACLVIADPRADSRDCMTWLTLDVNAPAYR